MYIQSVSNTNFGKIGKFGGHEMGRSIKGKKPQADYIKVRKQLQNFKTQVKSAYNSSDISGNFGELCEKFISKTIDIQNKLIKHH